MTTICEDLRKAVLQAAIQGKLTQQLPEDGNAEALYKEIQKEKQRLIKEGKIKREKPLPEITEEEIPFDIPENWKWVHIGEIGNLVRGSGIKKDETTSTGYQCVRYGEIYTTYYHSFSNAKTYTSDAVYNKSKHITKGDLIFTLTGENKQDIAKTIAYLGDDSIAVGGDLAIWTNHLCDPRYLSFYMYSSFAIEQKRAVATGDIIVHISCDKVGRFIMPLPPLAEQKRIVAKVDELMAKVAELKRTEGDIKALYEVFPGDMKASLIQSAIQGRLTEQLASDGDAETLYADIQKEKQRLIKEGKIKKENPLPAIADDDIPFDIPENWKWVHVGEVVKKVQYGTAKKSSKTGLVPVLRMGNIQNGKIDYSSLVYTSDADEINHYALQKDDLLFNRTNSREQVGKVAIYKAERPAIYAGYLVRITPVQVDSDYLNYVMQTTYYWEYCQAVKSDAIGQSNINAEKLKNFIFPLPPLSEQKRIVEKLDQLLPLCDAMNAEITGGESA